MNDTVKAQAQPDDSTPTMTLRAQYVKDLSFENPRAPQSLFNLREAPEMEISINLNANKLEETIAELEIHIGLKALSDNQTVFRAELVYAGVVELRNLSPKDMEKALFVTGAYLLYPFARRVIADATRDGGFPPVQLEPIDFSALYLSRQQPVASA
jgi:preprotein translocase subunit SecB